MACEHCNNTKTKVRTAEEKKALKTRVNKIAGQVNGISKMIDDSRYCGDILTQLAAIDKSIKSLASVILENHMHSCVIDAVNSGDMEVLDEVTELFKRFN